MKKLIVAATIVSFYFVSSFAQPDTLWTKTYGGSGDDWGISVQHTTDGGYIITGGTTSFGAGGTDVYLIKTDGQGNQVWYNTFFGDSYGEGLCVQQTADEGYIIAGYTYSTGSSTQAYLIKTDSQGNPEWENTFGGVDEEMVRYVQQTSDSGYILSGYTCSFGLGGRDIYLVKTDNDGDMQWYSTYGSQNDDYGRCVRQTSDGGYLIAGGIDAIIGTGNGDGILIKTNNLGQELWQQVLGGDGADEFSGVCITSDGGYILGGWTWSFGVDMDDFYLVKTDNNGNELWGRTYGGENEDLSQNVIQTNDGGYMLSGRTNSFGAGDMDGYMVKTDSAGNQQWDMTLGGIAYDYAFDVKQANDNGYIICGYTDSFGYGGVDVYLIRLNAEGSLVENFGREHPANFTLYPCSPNPFNASTTISFDLPTAGEVSLKIYDIAGREVQSLVTGHSSLGKHSVVWDAGGQASGIYFAVLEAGGFSQTQKVVLLK